MRLVRLPSSRGEQLKVLLPWLLLAVLLVLPKAVSSANIIQRVIADL
jgi:hypothetical protein